jgi:hypothetical protein
MSTRIVDGRIERGSSYWPLVPSLQYLSWQRVLFLMVVAGIFVLTNPENQGMLQPPTPVEPTSWALSWSSLFRDQELSKPTNYLFFSVKETRQALMFMFLQESWACRYDDIEIGFVCEFLTPHLSHGKPVLWDERDPVHTAHRSICWALILAATVSFCFTSPFSRGRLLDNPFIDSLFSVFYRPHLLYDLLHANVVVYPALRELYHILPQLRADAFFSTGSLDMDYALSVILLVMVIGGGANYASSLILANDDTCNHGFSSVVAASMAYTQRLSMIGAPPLLRIGDMRLTTTDLYWAELGLLLLQANRRSISTMIAWIVAGLLGSALAKYQLGNIVVFGGIYKFLGLA